MRYFIIAHKRLTVLLLLLLLAFIALFTVAVYTSSASFFNLAKGYIKFTNVSNKDIISNTKDVSVAYSASIFTEKKDTDYFGKIEFIVFLANGEVKGIFENTKHIEQGTTTFHLDLLKLDDETPVKLLALGYLHTAPKELLKLWNDKRISSDKLQKLLINTAQYKIEVDVIKNDNPFALPKGVNPDDVRVQNPCTGNCFNNTTIRQPDTGILSWINYEFNDPNSIVPHYRIDFPSTWLKKGDGNTGVTFSKLSTTTGISINDYPAPTGTDINNYLKQMVGTLPQNYICVQFALDGKAGEKCDGLNGGNSYIHDGDKEEMIILPYASTNSNMLIILDFINDKYSTDDSSIWEHILNSFHIY